MGRVLKLALKTLKVSALIIVSFFALVIGLGVFMLNKGPQEVSTEAVTEQTKNSEELHSSTEEGTEQLDASVDTGSDTEGRILETADDKAAAEKMRQTITNKEGLIMKYASLCLVVGEWALYQSRLDPDFMSDSDQIIATALAEKGRSWDQTFAQNVGEGSYVYRSFLETRAEDQERCENNYRFRSCWNECIAEFD